MNGAYLGGGPRWGGAPEIYEFMPAAGTNYVQGLDLNNLSLRYSRYSIIAQVNGRTIPTQDITATDGLRVTFNNIAFSGADIVTIIKIGFFSAADYKRNVQRGYLFGMTMSNNASDATNDIDFTEGECASQSTIPYMISCAAMTKRLDANWAPGTGNGMRNSAVAIANGTYHIWACGQDNAAGGDYYAHTSAVPATVLAALQAETGGSTYTYVRRIGSIVRAAATIIAFRQDGDRFLWFSPILDVNNATGSTSGVTRTITVPTGIVVDAIVSAGGIAGSDLDGRVYVSSFAVQDDAASVANYNVGVVGTAGGGSGNQAWSELVVRTNTSGQIRSRALSTITAFFLGTHGWIDTRGQMN